MGMDTRDKKMTSDIDRISPKSRIKGFDFLKGIACFAVVMIHVPFPYPLNIFCGFYNWMAVPTFFAISGYFSYKGDLNKTNLHLIKQGGYSKNTTVRDYIV